MALEPGQIIDGKYRVVRRIGEGGMGTVYEGENVRIERRVAIKVLHAQVASQPEFASRFEREARASARIGSPHVCDVLDLGDLPNGERFMVMEFLEGESLEERIARGRLTADQLAPIAFEMLDGLGTMHNAGVIHRDLKPANVFLHKAPGRRGEIVKILDFGVAKILPKADENANMTSTGIMMGTPLYMSPEQARGARDVDARTDLYAASVIFYRAISGFLPYTAENLHELLFKIVLEDPKPLHHLAPDVDEAFCEIVMKGLKRDANERYKSAREYQEAIAAWGNKQGRTSLQFTVSLPTKPPPLLASLGPPIPKTAESPPPISNPISSEGPDPSGTPTAWSEDAPAAVKKAVEVLHTLPAATSPMPAAATAISPQAPPLPAASRAKRSLVLPGVIAVAALAIGAFAAMRVISTPSATSTASVTTTAEDPSTTAATPPPKEDPPPQPDPDPPPVASSDDVPPSPATSASASASIATPTPTAPPPATPIAAKVAAPAPRPATPTKPPAAPSATPVASAASSAPPPPAPTTTASGKARKFRTNLD